MLQTFILSYKLKNTYRVNSILYSIKQLPIIKKILPDRLYKSKALKIIGNILSTLIEICSIFLGKFIYIYFCIFCMLSLYKIDKADVFLHLFFFLTLIGSILNTYMFNPTKDKYYAMMILKMDAKKYTLSNYFYAMIKTFLGFLPFTILFGRMVNVPLWICISMPLFVVCSKISYSAYILKDFEKTKIAKNENNLSKITWLILALFLVLAYGLPYLGITISSGSWIFFFLISFVCAFFSIRQILSFDQYKQIYKQILTMENVYAVQNASSTQTLKDNVSKQIELDQNLSSKKQGFAYFHDVFVKRHRKILTKAVKKQAAILLLLFILLTLFLLVNPNMKKQINQILLVYLPYFVFILYCMNRSSSVTQAMFMNCDHSMLTYRFYRTPNVILGIFKERLKTLITINLFPAALLGLGLAFFLYLSGGTDHPSNYFILIFSILAMSVFFSVHYLVLYYLLQPYNANTEIKSSTYTVVQGLTYFVCYFFIGIKLPTVSFGIAMIIFCIAYSLISFALAYKKAPKTFKLRI